MALTLDGLMRGNLETVLGLEREIYGRFTPLERFSHRVTRAFGSLRMVALHALGLLMWFVVNSGMLPLAPFDPWPFHALVLTLALESLLLSFLILISQRVMQQMDNHRTHLALQIGLLAEQESTKILEALTRMEHKLGTAEKDEQRDALSQSTAPQTLSEAIAEHVHHGAADTGP